MKPHPHVSLIVCTRNRADALKRCLAAIAAADADRVPSELIIVDNGSVDETAAIIRSFAEKAPLPVRAVEQRKVGLSNARNAGLAQARGEILAFTDDDCYVAGDYFTVVQAAYLAHPIDYTGGRIMLYDPQDAFYACNTDANFRLIPPKSFIAAGKIQGANMTLSRRAYEAVGPFDPALGAGTPFRCEDVDYVARMSAAGLTGAHAPQIVVHHHHGRRADAGLEKIKRDNDYARGAYYAKRLLLGDARVLFQWPRITMRTQNHHLLTELRGALDYLFSRMRPRIG
jgi:glycosyltransferase involved in cell wall biosynthesis